MLCNTCSNNGFTCSKSSFSIPTYPKCTISSYVPGVPSHYFNLICNNLCAPIIHPLPSPNHGIASNAYNGYRQPNVIVIPGHTVSCPTCPTCLTCGCSCNND